MSIQEQNLLDCISIVINKKEDLGLEEIKLLGYWIADLLILLIRRATQEQYSKQPLHANKSKPQS